jgi:hypothetical protein
MELLEEGGSLCVEFFDAILSVKVGMTPWSSEPDNGLGASQTTSVS